MAKQRVKQKVKEQVKELGKKRVRIVGAGLAGLTLGRTLLQRGVPAVLYDRRPEARRHGYAVTLHEPAYRPLLDLLGLDLETFRHRVAVDARHGHRGTGRIDPALLVRRAPGVDYATSFRANRHNLVKLLAEDLDIRHGDEVESVSPGTAPGLVALHMEGAAAPNLVGLNSYYKMMRIPYQVPPPFSLQTDCLVGADGALSAVRRALAPDTPVGILPYVVYSGWRRLTQKQFNDHCAPAMQGSTVIETRTGGGEAGGAVLSVTVNDAHTGALDVGWAYSRPVRGGAADPLHMPNREVDEAKHVPKALYEELGALGELEQPFRYMLDPELTKVDGHALHWLMRTALVDSEDLYALAGTGAFLVGDAAHAQPILGGEGALSAITDAVGLGNCIADHGPSGIPAWYDTRYDEWEAGVRNSVKAIREIHGGR